MKPCLVDKLCAARQSERLGMCIYCRSPQGRSNSLYCVTSQSLENGNCRVCKNPWMVCELRTEKRIDDFGAERWSEETTCQTQCWRNDNIEIGVIKSKVTDCTSDWSILGQAQVTSSFVCVCGLFYGAKDQWRTVGVFNTPPPPKFWSFDKAEPNSKFRGKYIRNCLVFLFHHPNKFKKCWI
jgi:hypothetical protein